jgi:hypothetical protein
LGLFFFFIQSIDIGGTMILLMAKKQTTIIISQPSILFYFKISRWNAARMKKNTILITSYAQLTSIHCVVDTK